MHTLIPDFGVQRSLTRMITWLWHLQGGEGRKKQWNQVKVGWSDESLFFLTLLRWHDGVSVCHFFGEYLAPGCTIGRRKTSEGSLMLWAMYCWETLGSAIHVAVTLTCATYIKISVDHVHPFMQTIFPGGRGFQQHNVACQKVKNSSTMAWWTHNNEF